MPASVPRVASLAAMLILGCAMAVPASSGAEAKRPGTARVAAVGTTTMKLRWKDRSRGERAFRIKAAPVGAASPVRAKRVRRNRESGRLAGLAPGVLYEVEIRVCGKRGKGCRGPHARLPRQATLLAPFNGPHPIPDCATFPAGDSFNRDISADPVAANSDAIVDRINSEGGDSLHPDFGSNPRYGIPFVVVPALQPAVPVGFTAYGDESDPGPYPIPPGAPIEGGSKADGDRHIVILQQPDGPGEGCRLYETYRSFESGGRRGGWKVDSGAIFDLRSPLAGQRPAGWTSADAAGLPIYPGLVTYEEASSGVIDHAIRITFVRTRREYISPATHFASSSCGADLPAMGMRLRLRASYDISGLAGRARTIAIALQRYGAIVADNGSNWFISGSTDRRWDDDELNRLKEIPGSAFEVVDVPGAASVTDC